MIQNIFWVICLCLQLMRVQAQLDLPNTSAKQAQSKTLNVTPDPQQYLQPQQQQPFLNSFIPNYEFGQPQLPYAYNNYIPINNNYQPRPVIQINNRPFPNQNDNNNNNTTTTRPLNHFNLYGRLDNNFGPGHFGNDYIGHLRPRPPLLQFPQINLGNYPRQNLVTPHQTVVTPTANTENALQNNGKPDEASPSPPGGQIPQPPPLQPNYGVNFGVRGYGLPTIQPGFQFQPGFDPTNPQQQFHPFSPNFGRFDFGHNVSPPQTIEHNLQVTGSPTNRGLPPQPNNPVVGFYGPPPNLGVFSYPTLSPGFNYQNGQTNLFVRPDPESESVEDQPPAINPK